MTEPTITFGKGAPLAIVLPGWGPDGDRLDLGFGFGGPWWTKAPNAGLHAVIEAHLRAIIDSPTEWLVDPRAALPEVKDALTQAMNWRTSGQDSATMRAWVPCAPGMDARHVKAWIEQGATPHDMEQFGDLRAWWFATAHDLPRTRAWGELWRCANPDLAVFGHAEGVSAASVARVATAVRTHGDPEKVTKRTVASLPGRDTIIFPFSRARVATLRFMLRAVGPQRWDDVAACVEAGMTVAEAARHIANGRDMEPIRLMAGLRER